MSDRVAVVTGAASGIGLAVAERLATRGYRLVLVDRSPDVAALAQRLGGAGGTVEGMTVDLADGQAVPGIVSKVEAAYGRLDVLVNNAGIHPKKPDGSGFPLEEVDAEAWSRVLAINLTAPFLLSREAVRLMKSNGWGRIINIASRAGRMYIRSQGAHYTASKSGLIGLTRVIAGECSKFGITANCIAPGRIKTPLADQGGSQHHQTFAAQVPAGRIGTPEEIAATVEFLTSDEAGFITGAIIDVNGGAFMT